MGLFENEWVPTANMVYHNYVYMPYGTSCPFPVKSTYHMISYLREISHLHRHSNPHQSH